MRTLKETSPRAQRATRSDLKRQYAQKHTRSLVRALRRATLERPAYALGLLKRAADELELLHRKLGGRIVR
jgi:hypothetical protein